MEFVFCIIDPRFIDFFLPMIENLGRDRCALLSLSNGDVALEAKRHGLQLCPTRYSRVQLGALGRPPAALYPRYAIAVDQYLKALGTLEWMRPRTVIFGEAASFEEEIVAQAARSLRMRTVRVQHGRAGVIHPGYYDMPYDLMLMWGQGFVDRLKPTSPDCRYEITGSPLIDQRAANALDPHLAAFMESKPTVTVISQPQSTNILRSDYEALVSVVDGVMRSATGLNVLVRLHPADKAQDFAQLAQTCPQRMRVTRSQDFPLNAILRYSSVVVGLYSTALTEAVAVGVVPVVLRLGEGERHRIFPSPEDSGAAELATSPEAAVAAICRLATDPTAKAGYGSRMETFVRHYFGPAGGSAVARIVARIENANTGGGARQ
ncbi:MAG: hypothetical protein GTO41_05915 [Burkholderiales bacterium]|nr:hypothetical protein [Burkholderiales bacterium]